MVQTNKPLRVLHLEDDLDFPALVADLLVKEGIRTQLIAVNSLADFKAALESDSFDIILADYSLPSCNGIQALESARSQCPDVPFLLVSGTIGEQAAIESLRCGATDYVLKQGLERLAPAVRRAVQEAHERTQRKQAESELARREKYFRTLTENSLDILTILNREGNFQYNSPSVKTVLGYEPAELVGQNAFAFVHPEDLPATQRAFERALRNPEQRVTHEFRFCRPDGSWCHLETVGQNRLGDPDIAAIVLNSRDVSDRKRAEAEVRESEKQYHLIFDGNPVPMWLSDLETQAFLEVNQAAVRHYGYSRDEFLEMTTKDIRSPEEAARLVEYLTKVVHKRSKENTGQGGLWRHRKKDGPWIDVEITWSVISFKGREILLTMANDVTELRKTAEALKKSETSLAAAQRIANLGSWEVDLLDWDNFERNPLRWSDEAYRIYGYQPQQFSVNGGLFLKTVHPNDVERVREAMREAFKTRTSYDLEHRVLLPNGVERTVRERAEFAPGEGGLLQMRGIVIDITERKHLEEQLRQSQKMEAIGQLAGGVAHDFNNILTVIHGHASLLLTDKNLSTTVGRSAKQIVQAAERAAGLTRQLLAFSRRQVMQPQRLELNELVSSTTMMLGRVLGEHIALQLSYSPQPAWVTADASMVEQVILNLAVNARDAMPKGGQLSIRVVSVTVDARHLIFHPEARPGSFVRLSVADNGCGIPPENLRRIFEPFFTTKEVGKGTGLGLATVYGIVEQHQGWVEVESNSGQGAAFHVYLPGSAPASVATREEADDRTVRGGTETVLVVEDEAPVRELVCRVLTRFGYTVLEAESGPRALEVWQHHGEKVDLLLTDLVMPDQISGRELAEKLRSEHAKLRVIFTSGYSAEAVGKEFAPRSGWHYLQKPYDPRKLAQLVRDCLDS